MGTLYQESLCSLFTSTKIIDQNVQHIINIPSSNETMNCVVIFICIQSIFFHFCIEFVPRDFYTFTTHDYIGVVCKQYDKYTLGKKGCYTPGWCVFFVIISISSVREV